MTDAGGEESALQKRLKPGGGGTQEHGRLSGVLADFCTFSLAAVKQPFSHFHCRKLRAAASGRMCYIHAASVSSRTSRQESVFPLWFTLAFKHERISVAIHDSPSQQPLLPIKLDFHTTEETLHQKKKKHSHLDTQASSCGFFRPTRGLERWA